MREYYSFEACRFDPNVPVIVAMGFFDGLHSAHRAILQQCKQRARERGGIAVALTFHNHPSTVLRPENPTPLLSPFALKRRWFAHLGMDALVAVPFTLELSRTAADEFIQRVLLDTLHAREIVVGFNFCFGYNREGTATYLQERTPDLFDHVAVIEPLTHGDETISSSRIRQAVIEGDLQNAQHWLGHPVQVAGPVVRGDGRGTSIGIPTANIDYDNHLLPPNGVYGVQVQQDSLDAPAHWGVMNIGVVPTFKNELVRTAEVHLLDYQDDLYDQYLIASLLHSIRPERKFSGPEELINQIDDDISAFRQWIEQNAKG
mgnify:CR=1 FL=1